MHVMSDLHGSKDITLECEDNVVLHKNKTVIGSTFNNILLSLFTLNSNSKYDKIFPGAGGRSSWEVLEECLSVMLLTISTVDHILQRLFHLILSACFEPCSKDRRENLAGGALSFIYIWTTKYWKFISPQDFSHMKQMLEEFLSHLLQPENTIFYNFVNYYADLIRKCIATCSNRGVEGAITPIIISVALGTWDNTAEKNSFLDGSLESIQLSKALEMRKPVDTTPPVIAIFGVTQDMLAYSDDEEDDMPDMIRADAVLSSSSVPTPEARISLGYNMLQDYRNISIWDFDVKEIARQWTLMDHSLFLAIPLTNLHCCRWADPRYVSEANEVRCFIDRFNAQSCWVTQSLLNQDTPRKRAALYMKFIFLASFLLELNNFNGLMAILTAVQQVLFLCLMQ